jgi:ElaB/YqjD/DUF883 family membrane-anchored ribosome-binding protein
MKEGTNIDELTGARSADQARALADDLSGAASRVVGEPGHAQYGMEQVASNFKRALDRSTAEQPLATFALAAVVGFVFGVLWKA